jgi:hypothetical protein
MSSTNSDQKKYPWYQDIRAELSSRYKQCTDRHGEYNGYTPVSKNPYSHKSLEEFKAANPFHVNKTCKYRRPTKEMDKYLRYYKDPKTSGECDRMSHKSKWDYASANRAARYEYGQCWAEPTSAKCGAKVPIELVMPAKDTDVVRRKAIKETAERACKADDECAWVELGVERDNYDCFSKKKLAENTKAKNVKDPPENMPRNVTSPSSEISQYLYNWYKDSKPGPPPTVGVLEGTGNRCSAGTSNGPSFNLKQKYTKEELKTMPFPLSNGHIRVLETALGVIDANKVIKMHRARPKGDDHLSMSVWNKELYLDAEDLLPEDEASEFTPSLPQSVVNMIMKNIVRTDSSNRGMMAWHSTGSGKTCTAAGVMDAVWDSNKQIVFASSLDAIASNPDYKFHECASRLFPRFKEEPFNGSMGDIGYEFGKRGIIFVSFAKLANRVKKTEELKRRLGIRVEKSDGNVVEGRGKKSKKIEKEKEDVTSDEDEDDDALGGGGGRVKKEAPKKKTKAKAKAKAKAVKEVKVKPIKPTKSTKPTKPAKEASISSSSPIDFIVSCIEQWYDITDTARVKKELREIGIIKIEDFVDLDNTVLIIDEVHNLFRPLATQKKEHNYVEAHLVNPVMHPGLKVVVLTATPGDNVNDVMKLLNIVRDPTNPVIRPPNPESAEDVMRFKNDIRGLISYFEMSNDITKFPKVLDNGPIKYPMSTTQFAKYFEAYNAVAADAMNYDKLAKENQLNKFWAGARRYSNMLFKLEKGMGETEFSSKLPALLQNIGEYPSEKHYVYSAFFSNMGSSHGILEIARQLEAKGYTKLTVKDAKEANKAGKTLPPGKRYMLALPSEIAPTSTSAAASATAGKNLHEMINIFNSTANAKGQIVEVFLATKGFNEGLDLKAVRHIHIFEPLVTMASDLQTIGRARRYCSHADLDHKDWTVQIHRYLSDFPVNVRTSSTSGIKDRLASLASDVADLAEKAKGTKDAEQKKAIKQQVAVHKADIKKLNDEVKRAEKMDVSKVKNIDEFIYQEAQSRMRELFVVYHSMKEAAMDCFLLKKFHSDDTINCL